MARDVMIRPERGAVAPVLPGLPPDVRHAIAVVMDPDQRHVPVLPETMRERLAMVLADADARAAPADRATVARWAVVINGSVRRELDESAFALRVDAITAACSDLPAWAFSPETQTEALRAFPWFPSAAEVRKLLGEATARRRGEIAAVRVLATVRPNGWPDPVRSAPPSAEEIAAVRGLVEMAKRGMAAAGIPEKPPARPTPRYADPATLAAIRARNPLVQAAIKESAR